MEQRRGLCEPLLFSRARGERESKYELAAKGRRLPRLSQMGSPELFPEVSATKIIVAACLTLIELDSSAAYESRRYRYTALRLRQCRVVAFSPPALLSPLLFPLLTSFRMHRSKLSSVSSRFSSRPVSSVLHPSLPPTRLPASFHFSTSPPSSVRSLLSQDRLWRTHFR
jgi:hypothetical protein